jgi:thiamine-phosphate pyrophosphorylase
MPLPDVVRAAFDGGCRWTMVREKDLSTPELAALVADIVEIAAPYGALVSVSGDAAAARMAGAHGLHLPQGAAVPDDRDGLLTGVSTHSLEELRHAVAAGADYVTFGPVFPSLSKPGYGPAAGDGVADLKAAVCETSCPAIALGGVTAENAAVCRAAGAAGIGVIGAIVSARYPAAAAAALIAAI